MPPLTGLVAIYGTEIVRAARIAVEEINEHGGVLGRPIELIVEDDGSLPDTAVPAALRLVEEHGCVAIIGNLLSNSRIAVAAQVAEPKRIPLLNFSFYEGSISGRYFFHFAALPNQQIDKMIPFMAKRYGPKMFFAGNNYEWPRGSIDAAMRALKRCDGEILGEEYLPIGCTPEMVDYLLGQVARSGADVFVPYFAGTDQITLLTRFTELGLKSQMAVVMGHYDEALVSHLAPEVRAEFYSCNTYFMALETDKNRAVLQRLRHQPGVDGLWPQGNGVMTNFGEGAYACVMAFAKAATAAGTLEAEALVDALETVCVEAPQGLIVMDAATHHASVNTLLTRCRADGSFEVIERFGREPPQIPERYRPRPSSAQLQESLPTPELTARYAAEIGAAQIKLGTARQILSIADMGIIATDEQGIISEANRSASVLFGYPVDEMLGLSIHLLVPPHFRQQHIELMRRFVASEESERRMSSRNEIMGYRKDGSFFPIEASIAKFRNGDAWLLVVSLRDTTERKQAEEELTRRATHDPLTGLPNRSLIRERLAKALQRSRRSGLAVVLLFIDLDGFKLVNDTHGHEAGDSLLKTVAARLLQQVRPGDTVARLAGDEFVIICEQVEQPATMSMLAERINDSLREPVLFDSQPLFVTASIGIAIGTGSTHAAEDLLRAADTAMYAAKEKGRDSWQFFSEGLQEQARQRLSITSGLRLAIEHKELSTRFQPIVAAESGRIVGAELLLRWHPPQGEVSPAVFIPIAETTGVIVPIGAWVFRAACQAEVEWRARWGDRAPYVSVNVSARQLAEPDLAEEFAAILKATGAFPTRLLLEITETSLMADVDANLRVLRRLADLGLRVAVDDFGTGYSSLAQLSRMPVDVLKIDRAFVDGIDKSAESRTIIRAVISLGRALGLKLVAEGVENAAQQRELCGYGCDFIQGYYFHRPLEEARFIELMQGDERNDAAHQAEPLYYILYVSRATPPPSLEARQSLLARALAANRASGVSGCLMFKDNCFMQMLEGTREQLHALFERIRHDPRHDDVRIVAEGAMRRRAFTDWGMVWTDLDQETGMPDFSAWQQRRIDFFELAADPRLCYAYITAFAAMQPYQSIATRR